MLQIEQGKVVCTYEDEENLKAFIKQKNIPDEYFDKLNKILYRVYGTVAVFFRLHDTQFRDNEFNGLVVLIEIDCGRIPNDQATRLEAKLFESMAKNQMLIRFLKYIVFTQKV